MSQVQRTIINHNAAVVSASILHQEAPSQTRELAQNVFDRAVAGAYKSPIEVQASAIEMQHSHNSPQVAQSAKLLADSAELTHKLPVFDVQQMREEGIPDFFIKSAEHVNGRFTSGTDSDSIKAQTADNIASNQSNQSNQSGTASASPQNA